VFRANCVHVRESLKRCLVPPPLPSPDSGEGDSFYPRSASQMASLEPALMAWVSTG
jgi:hypothetical protein